ncbi:unnamed protein product [Chrysoparadoxa australica]
MSSIRDPIVAGGIILAGIVAAVLVLRKENEGKDEQKTPSATDKRKYFTPAEWDPHTRTWMLWPCRPDNWRKGAVPARKAFAMVANTIARFEPVTVGAPASEVAATKLMLDPGVQVVPIEADDAWVRDTGPIFAVNRVGGIRAVLFRFNAWGGEVEGCYKSWDRDARVGERIASLAGVECCTVDMVLEGGAVHLDGEGTALVTAETLLNPNRNGSMTKWAVEGYLRDYLGCTVVIWLEHGLEGDDDTNGHIDNMAAFVRPGVVVLHWEAAGAGGGQHARSEAALAVLECATDARGRRLEVHKLHAPPPLYITQEEAAGVERGDDAIAREAGTRLAASYVNFYMVNKGVIMPGFGAAEEDLAARRVLAGLCPERAVVQLQTREILLGGGNIHCITKQEPWPYAKPDGS